MVPADSHRISRVPRYSGYRSIYSKHSYGSITLYGNTSSILPRSTINLNAVLQPQNCRNNFGLGSSHFARHYFGNHCYFLFLQVLRCFSSPGLLPFGFMIFNHEGCPIRKSTPRWLFAPQCSLSQLITSFIAVKSQGILHLPLIAY